MEPVAGVALLALLGSLWAWLRRRKARARFQVETDRGSFYASLRARSRPRPPSSSSLEPPPFNSDHPTGRHKPLPPRKGDE